MKKRLPFLILPLVIIAGILTWFLFFKEKTDPNLLMVSGNIEATDVQLGFKIAGRLEQCLVNEGDTVSKGDLLASLENQDQQISVRLARANLARAESILAELTAGSRPEEIELSRAKVLQAGQMLLELTRGSRAQEIEGARADLARALAAEKSANAQLIQAQKEDALVRVTQAELQLSYTQLFAPMAGVILSRSAEPGEYFNPSTPVLTLGDIAHPWLRAFVSETHLGRIKLKDRVKVTTDSFPGKSYEGILSFISSQAEFTPKSVQTFEERVKLMFRIKIDLSNPDQELKPGMPAEGIIAIPVP